MFQKFLFVATALFTLRPVLSAAEPTAPTCTPAEEDSTIFNGQSARAFFAARAADGACAQKYQQAKAAFDEARAGLQKLVASGASADELDNQASRIDAARTPYLEALSTCGPCAARPIAEPIQIDGAGRPQYWYQSDGSCQLPENDRAKLGRVFDKLSDVLTRVTQYPRNAKAGTGFNPILALYAIDPSNGQQLPAVDKIPADKATTAFISIQGPLATAFSYYFDATYKTYEQNGARQFTMHEEGVTPDGAHPPRTITYLTAGGKRKLAINTQLAHANGQWYVNEDGYIRYCTSADFGLRSQFVETFGRNILLDILSTAVEKAAATE